MNNDTIYENAKISSKTIEGYVMVNAQASFATRSQIASIKEIVSDLEKLCAEGGILDVIMQPNIRNIPLLLGFDPDDNNVLTELPEVEIYSLSSQDKVLYNLAINSEPPRVNVRLLPKNISMLQLRTFISTAPAELVNSVGGYKAFKFNFFDHLTSKKKHQLIAKINVFMQNNANQDVSVSQSATSELIQHIAQDITGIIQENIEDVMHNIFTLAHEGKLTGKVFSAIMPDPKSSEKDNTTKIVQADSQLSSFGYALKSLLAAQRVIHESLDESLLEQIFKILNRDERHQVFYRLARDAELSFAKYDRRKLTELLS